MSLFDEADINKPSVYKIIAEARYSSGTVSLVGDVSQEDANITYKPKQFKPTNKNYSCCIIKANFANDIVKQFHYSGKVVSNSILHLGIFNINDELVGCLQFGYPMNGEKTASKISNQNPMLELNRMVMTDDEPRNAESQAISLSLKWLRANTNINYILSFSDGKESNCGYIYQATNWKYLGYALSSSFYDIDGVIMHSVSVWHKYKEKHKLRDKLTTHEIMGTEHQNISIITAKQHIYVMPVVKRVSFKHTEKAYPKVDTETPIIKRQWVYKHGVKDNTLIVYDDAKMESIL